MALQLKITVKRVGALRAALRRKRDGAPRALARALYAEAEAIMAASKRIVPVDTGALRASGHVRPPVIRGSRVRVVLGYGGAAVPYAVFVHERPATHRPPTQWKYLEVPLHQAEPGMAGRLAERVRNDIIR